MLFVNSIHLLWFYPSSKIGFPCVYPSHFNKVTDTLHFSQQCYYVSSIFPQVRSSFLYFLAYLMLGSYFTSNFSSLPLPSMVFISSLNDYLYLRYTSLYPMNMLEICWKCWTRPHGCLLVLGR